MARPGKPSIFDRKLEELQRQSELVQGDLRTLQKSLRRIEEGEALPALQSSRLEKMTMRPAAVAVPPAPPPVAEKEPEAPPYETQDRDGRGQSAAAEALADDSTADEWVVEPESPEPGARQRPLQPTPHFKKYLATGSFGGGRPLAEERRVQRNKAIFMLVIVGLGIYVVIRLFL